MNGGISVKEKNLLDNVDPSSNLCQCVNFFRDNYKLRKNIITGDVEDENVTIDEKYMVIDDREINTVFLQLSNLKLRTAISKEFIHSYIESKYIPMYNPFIDFIDKNSKVPRSQQLIIDLARTIESDTPLQSIEKYIRHWGCGMIASIYGSQSPLTLVLAGAKLNTGKCLAKGTKVMMADTSVKNVENIVSGDMLMGLNGSMRLVKSICSGSERMYTINQKNGESYTVNESHILSLKNRITKKTINISIRDYLKTNKTFKVNHSGYKSELISTIDFDLPINPYLFGIWLGDGTGKKDKKNLKADFANLNLSNNKHIPLVYKRSSTNQRLQLLAGIIDTDGHYTKDFQYEIIQVSKLLSDDILFLVRSLGFKATQTTKIINNKNYYRILFSGDLEKIPVKIKYKKAKNNKKHKQCLLTSIEVIESNETEYFGFEIDGDKLFLLSDFTVTHNTEFFRRLLPKKLLPYYAESALDGGKDDDILMCKKLIIMDDEFGGKSKTDQRHFKSMTSKQVMAIRVPYGRKTQEMRRICSLAGTSNDVSLLSDPYGNRRILPINVLGINHAAYNAIDKTALFLAFYDLYKSGFHWKFKAEDIQQLNEASEDFHAPNPEAELIEKFFCIPEDENDGEYMTNTLIKDILETKTKQKIWNPTKLGIELVNLGFKRFRKGKQRVYLIKERPVMAHVPPHQNTQNYIPEFPQQDEPAF